MFSPFFMSLNNIQLFLFSSCVKTFNELFSSQNTEADILNIVSKAEEFEQLKVRCLQASTSVKLPRSKTSL